MVGLSAILARTIQNIFLVRKRMIRTQELGILGHYCVCVFCISNNEQNSSYLLRLIQAGKTHSVCREGGKPL